MRFDTGFLKNIKPFLFLVWDSLTPTRYPYLSGKPVRESYSYLIKLVLVCFVIAAVFFIPILVNIDSGMDAEFSKFNRLELDPVIDTRAPVYIPYAKIYIDTKQDITDLGDYNLVISQHHVLWRPLSCMLFEPFCWISPDKEANLTPNIKENKEAVLALVKALLLVALPVLVIVLFVLYTIKYLVITVVAAILAFLVVRLMLHRVSLSKLLNVAVYSTTVLVLLEVLNLPFQLNLYYFPFMLFLAYFVTGVVLVSEKKHGERQKEPR